MNAIHSVTEQSDSTDPTTASPLVTDTTIRELPPSCKLVWVALDRGEATQQALTEATGMSQRTVRYALDRLSSEELIEIRPYPWDARQSIYSLG
jgi:transcription initiation factor IIE alpha subunit